MLCQPPSMGPHALPSSNSNRTSGSLGPGNTTAAAGRHHRQDHQTATTTPVTHVAAISTIANLMSIFFEHFTKMMEAWEAKLAMTPAQQLTPRARFRNSISVPSSCRGNY